MLRYLIQHYVTCDRSVNTSTNKTDRRDITEIFLKVALNTITQVGHYINLFINSSSKTYTLEDFLTKTEYVLSCSC